VKQRDYRARAWLHQPCLWLVLFSVLMGCSSVSTAHQSSTPTATAIPMATSTATATPIPTNPPLDMAHAWGNIPVTSVPLQVDATHDFLLGCNETGGCLSGDGQWILGWVIDDAQDYSQGIAMLNVTTHHLRTLLPTTASEGIFSAASDGAYFAWCQVDNHFAANFSDWRIYLYDLTTDQLTLVAQAETYNGHPIPDFGPIVSLSHNLLVWGQSHATGGLNAQGEPNEDHEVKAYDLTSGQTTVMATNAYYASLSWPWMVWFDTIHKDLVITNLMTQQRLIRPEQPFEVALQGTSLVYSAGDWTSLMLIDDITQVADTGTPIVTARSDITSDYVEFPSINDRLVTWVGDNGECQVWDRVQHRIVTLLPFYSSGQGFTVGPSVSGPYLLWTAPISLQNLQAAQQHKGHAHNIAYILDTRQLPQTPPGS
jgi:hypothetical protein